jgi:hypothetical protein
MELSLIKNKVLMGLTDLKMVRPLSARSNDGQDFFAHKTGFTPKSLGKILMDGGFPQVYVSTSKEVLAVHALAFKVSPTAEQCTLLEDTWNLKSV